MYIKRPGIDAATEVLLTETQRRLNDRVFLHYNTENFVVQILLVQCARNALHLERVPTKLERF